MRQVGLKCQIRSTSYGEYLKELRSRFDPHGQLSERGLLVLVHSLEGTGSAGYWCSTMWAAAHAVVRSGIGRLAAP